MKISNILNTHKLLLIVVFCLFPLLMASSHCGDEKNPNNTINNKENMKDLPKTDSEWKQVLSPEQYNVLREKGTERPYTGEYNLFFEKGKYKCAACGEVLFSSDDKFESHCGWPSFSDLEDKSKIKEIRDTSHGMVRTEVVCAKCGGHLGHVFDDGPTSTGLRYCINSVSLDFAKDSTNQDSVKIGE